MLNRVRELLLRVEAPDPLPLTAERQFLAGTVCAAVDRRPIELNLGGRSLRLCPEVFLDQKADPSKDWFLVDGNRYLRGICGFLRISCKEKLLVGRSNEACQRLFEFPASVMGRQLEIENKDGRISITRLDPGGETYVNYVDDAEEIARPLTSRLSCLRKIRQIYGGPIELMPPAQALESIRKVNDILRDEAYRPKDSLGQPGGLLDLPAERDPVIVGDLHANLDNLLKILSENACLDTLRRGEACLVILGDAVHPHGQGDMTQMDTSLLILDLIFRLKITFPRNVFYLRGNHDSFDEWVGKAGVPQGVLLKRYARKLRGEAYEAALSEFFELLPYVVRSRDYIACHGGPTRRAATLPDLVNIRQHRELAQQLIWNRVKRPNRPGGYTKRDVSAFKKALGVSQETPLIVGHTPLSEAETLWLNVGEIGNHHIVFSANSHNLAVFVRSGHQMIPLVYPAESLVELTNALKVSG